MPSDQIVDAQDVLRAVLQLRRKGIVKIIAELESLEGDLLEYLLEEITSIHALLVKTGTTGRQIRMLDKRIQSLSAVLVLSLREAYLRLWKLDASRGRLAQIDPSLTNQASTDQIPSDDDASHELGPPGPPPPAEDGIDPAGS